MQTKHAASLAVSLVLCIGCEKLSAFFNFESSGTQAPAFPTSAEVRPQDRFYAAVNAKLLQGIVLPSNVPVLGADDAMTIAADKKAFRALKEGASSLRQGDKVNKPEQLTAQLYLDYTEPMTPGSRDLSALSTYITAIDSIQSKADLEVFWGTAQWMGFHTPLAILSGVDKITQTSVPVLTVSAEAVAVERMFATMQHSTQPRLAYQAMVATLVKMLGYTNDLDTAKSLAQLEHELYQVVMESRRPTQVSADTQGTAKSPGALASVPPKRMTVDELKKALPQFPWQAILNAAMVSDSSVVFVDRPSYFTNLALLVERVPLPTWKAYLKLSMIQKYAELLPIAYYKPLMTFRRDYFASSLPIDQRSEIGAYLLVKQSLGPEFEQSVSSLFASEQDKQDAVAIVRSTITSFLTVAPSSKIWSEAAWQAIAAKLTTMAITIGTSNPPLPQESLVFEKGALVKNFLKIKSLNYATRAALIGKPAIPRTDVPTVASYRIYGRYSWSTNTLVMTPAFLGPPVYYNTEDGKLINYGSFAYMVMRDILLQILSLDDLMSEPSKRALISRFASYRDIFNHRFAAKNQTMSDENLYTQIIPDALALSITRRAMLTRLQTDGGKPSSTVEQNFFLSFANLLRQKMSPDFGAALATGKHHLLTNEQRVDLLMMNSAEFQNAFGLKKGDKLFNPAPVDLW